MFCCQETWVQYSLNILSCPRLGILPDTVDTVSVGILYSSDQLPGERIKYQDTLPLTCSCQDLPVRVELNVENTTRTGYCGQDIFLLVKTCRKTQTWYVVLSEYSFTLLPPHVPWHAVEWLLRVLEVSAELGVTLAVTAYISLSIKNSFLWTCLACLAYRQPFSCRACPWPHAFWTRTVDPPDNSDMGLPCP